jgi:glucokinase
MILAGDVGGTKCNLAIFDLVEDRLLPIEEATFPSRDFGMFEEVVLRFLELKEVARIRATLKGAAFGIAGPIVRGRVKTPNLPWIIEVDSLQNRLQLQSVDLINDLEATGYGVLILENHEFQTLNEGENHPKGHMALIAAGTGLGEALLVRGKESVIPVPSEGGHTDFAPRNEVELDLLRYLMRTWSHVSYERVLSGPGLLNIYRFLSDSNTGEQAEWFQEKIAAGEDPAAVISTAALEETCPLCVQALDLFTSIYGAEAGNLALTVKAVGGVFVGGGIAPKILPKLNDGTFMKAFRDKGRMEPLMSSMPVHVVLNPKTALFGAANFARIRLSVI